MSVETFPEDQLYKFEHSSHLTVEQLEIISSELKGILAWCAEMKKVIELPENQREEAKADARLILNYYSACMTLQQLVDQTLEEPTDANYGEMTSYCLLNSHLDLPGESDGGSFFRFVWETSVGLRKFELPESADE